MLWSAKVKSNTAPETPLKNVLVLYSHNASADYLAGQHLKVQIGANFDSLNGIMQGELSPMMEGLRTTDGIQFHHFKNKTILRNSDDGKNINPAIDALEKYLKTRSETLDAVVIPAPYGHDYESASTIAWLSKMKERFPGMKVIIDGYQPWVSGADMSEHFAAARLDAQTSDTVRLDRNQTDYQLAEPIDYLSNGTSSHEQATLLRSAIGLPPMVEEHNRTGHSF